MKSCNVLLAGDATAKVCHTQLCTGLLKTQAESNRPAQTLLNRTSAVCLLASFKCLPPPELLLCKLRCCQAWVPTTVIALQVADVGLSKMISNSVGTKASGIGTLDWVSHLQRADSGCLLLAWLGFSRDLNSSLSRATGGPVAKLVLLCIPLRRPSPVSLISSVRKHGAGAGLQTLRHPRVAVD